jgi:hypothetical protein
MPHAVGQARPLRWLVAAPFGVPPTGRFVSTSGERFRTVMSRLAPRVDVQLPEGLGPTRRVRLELERPRDFRLVEVIRRVDPLGRLYELADELERSGKVEAALAKVRASVGEGELARAVQRLLEGGAAQVPAPAPAAATTTAEPTTAAAEPAAGGSALDAIFGKADVAATSAQADVTAAAKSGLDAFIGAMRKKGDAKAGAGKPVADRAMAKQVAELLRRAAEAAALDVMASPAVATLESSWRGLRMVVSDAPAAGDLAIDLLDTGADELVERLRPHLDVAPMDRPDAVFVALPLASLDTLRTLAELGARSFVPIIVEVPDAVTGARLEVGADPPAVPEAWAELRHQSASQWLCAAGNAVVLANEEVGGTRRIVFGSPVWGLAAMLSASVGQTGGPGHVFGRAGALVSPASYDFGDAGQTIATERLASVDQQRTLAERGVLVLGSERGSDRLRLAAAPTVHAGGHTEGDDLQLPGRILAGRAARFARAVRDELPPHATDQEVAARLAEASTNFLPRSPRGAVALQVRTDEHGKLGVEASISAVLAGASFEFSSDL